MLEEKRQEEEKIVIRMEGIVKQFPGIVANDHINFEVRAGEVHALLGENGAGKTTLMKVLYGLYHPDKGEIYVWDKKVTIGSPRGAIELGIGMVHQHFMLVSSHTVAENIALGLSSAKFLFPLREVRTRIVELSEKYGLKVDPDARIWQLSAGEQQRVEIVKALYWDADVLVLDEPTTMLTPAEIAVIRQMTKEGRTVVFITHKLDEVMAIADRVTVLRKGKVVETVEVSKTNKQELAKMMVGREILFHLKRKPVKKGQVVLEVKDLYVLGDKGLLAVSGVSFVIHKGEILGIAGVAGNGQRELVEVITGLRQATKGKVVILGEEMTNCSPRRIAQMGVAHIPEDRKGKGLVLNMTVAENLILWNYRYPPFSRGPFLDLGFINQHARNLVSEHNIMTPSVDTPVQFLSGGHLQRLILAREISRAPRLIIAAHPTYGLDVGAAEDARQLLLDLRTEKGVAILLVSEDLEEILDVSDRIAVMFRGGLTKPIETERAEIEEIGMMMGGIRRKEE